MNVRMIATDLDGTLLKDDKTVSRYTSSVFARCRERGIPIAFATARPVRTVGQLDIDIVADAVIYHNGAFVTIGSDVVFRAGIGGAAARELLGRAGMIDGLKISAEAGDVLYANFDASATWPGLEFIDSDLSDLPDTPVDKIIFVTSDDETIRAIKNILPGGLYAERTDNGLLMVMDDNARKITAVKRVAEYFSIPLDGVAAFGDDHNDVGMVRGCGIGVAVANANGEVKAAAGYICGSNERDGVARWIEERILS